MVLSPPQYGKNSAAGMLVSTTAIGTTNYIIRPFFRYPSYNATIGDYMYDSSCRYLFPLTAVGITIFTLSFGIGVGPVPGLLFTEYIPVLVRGLTQMVANILKGIAGMAIIGIFPSYLNISSSYLTWWTLALINLFGLVVVVLLSRKLRARLMKKCTILSGKGILVNVVMVRILTRLKCNVCFLTWTLENASLNHHSL